MRAFLGVAAVLAAIGCLPRAHAIVTAPGFELPNPWVSQGSYNDGSPVNAQLSGLGAIAPYGAFDAPSVGFAAWEKFSAGSFTGFAPQYTGDSGSLQATLAQQGEDISLSTTGSNPGLITVAGVDYYGRLTCGLDASYDFTLTATSAQPVASVTLAIKHSNFFEIEDPEDPEQWTQIAPFSATLNGIGSAPVEWRPDFSDPAYGNFSDALSLGTYTRYYLYTWEVDLAAGEEFAVDFSSLPEPLGFGFSVDAIALSVQAVPEPSAFALAATAAAVLGMRAWRRKS